MRDENPICTLVDYFKPSHEGYRNTIDLPIGNNVVPLRPDTIRLVQNGCSFHGLWFEDPNQHLKDFLKLMDSLDLDGEYRERTRLCLFQFFLCDQASNWLERLPAGSISTWEDLTTRFLAQLFPLERTAKLRNDILIGPYDAQYCMEDPEQAFVEYTSSRTDKAGVLKTSASNPHPQPDPLASITTKQVRKLNLMLESLGLVPQSSNTKFVCTKEEDGEVMFIEIIGDDDEPQNESLNEGEGNTMKAHGCSSNLKIPCNISHVHVKKAYIDLNSPLNIMTRMMYNWIMRRKLNPREDANGGISNFTGRIKGIHVFIGNFTYVVDFMIVEDISLIIDPRLSQVVLGRPFIEISNMTHDLPEGIVRNEEDKRRGVDYVMSKILGFNMECLELGPKYVTGLDDEGEAT
ncbi:MAK10-like protein [Tanacetum coccineum]